MCKFCNGLENIKDATIEDFKVEKKVYDNIFGKVEVGKVDVKRRPCVSFHTDKGTIRKPLQKTLRFCPHCGRELVKERK